MGYSKVKGPGTQAKPEQHPFFKRLAPIVRRTLEKCERENGLIYHQKVPYDPPELSICEKTYGLVKPEPYEMPERSPLWTAVAYAAFDIATDPDAKEVKAKAVRFSYDKQIVKEVLKPIPSFPC